MSIDEDEILKNFTRRKVVDDEEKEEFDEENQHFNYENKEYENKEYANEEYENKEYANEEYANEEYETGEDDQQYDFHYTFDQMQNSSKGKGGFIQGMGRIQYASKTANESYLERVETELIDKGIDESIRVKIKERIEILAFYITTNPEIMSLAVFFVIKNKKITNENFVSFLKVLDIKDPATITILLRYIRKLI